MEAETGGKKFHPGDVSPLIRPSAAAVGLEALDRGSSRSGVSLAPAWQLESRPASAPS